MYNISYWVIGTRSFFIHQVINRTTTFTFLWSILLRTRHRDSGEDSINKWLLRAQGALCAPLKSLSQMTCSLAHLPSSCPVIPRKQQHSTCHVSPGIWTQQMLSNRSLNGNAEPGKKRPRADTSPPGFHASDMDWGPEFTIFCCGHSALRRTDLPAQWFLCTGQLVNSFSFAGHMIPVTTLQL